MRVSQRVALLGLGKDSEILLVPCKTSDKAKLIFLNESGDIFEEILVSAAKFAELTSMADEERKSAILSSRIVTVTTTSGEEILMVAKDGFDYHNVAISTIKL